MLDVSYILLTLLCIDNAAQTYTKVETDKQATSLQPVLTQDGHVERWSTAPIKSFQIVAHLFNAGKRHLLRDDDKGSIAILVHRILKHRMNGNPMFFANFAAFASDSQTIAILETQVKDRVVTLDKDLFIAWRVEGKRVRISLGQGNNVVDARVGGGETPCTLSYVGGRLKII